MTRRDYLYFELQIIQLKPDDEPELGFTDNAKMRGIDLLVL